MFQKTKNQIITLLEGWLKPRELTAEEIRERFPAEEGGFNLYYGSIGNGKTYGATSDIFDDLRRGIVVYCSWPLDFSGYDERTSLLHVILHMFLFRKTFYRFPKENLHYLDIFAEDIWEKLENLTDCKIYLDEGYYLFDSYEKTNFSKVKRSYLLHTRHFNRTINIVSQRPNAVHITARSQVNRFFKMEKVFQWGSIIRFKRSEYQDMTQETVDETKEPSDVKGYWGRSRIFDAYNSWYLRNGIGSSQKNHALAWDYGFFARIKLLFDVVLRFVPLKRNKAKILEKSPMGVKIEEKALNIGERLNTIPKGRKLDKVPQDEQPF